MEASKIDVCDPDAPPSIQEHFLHFSTPFVITAIAVLSAACGVWLTSLHAWSRRLVPFGGGVLMGVAIFWVLPEMAEYLRWRGALGWILAGFVLLWAVDRFVYPLCPACSHSHDHARCATSLHGFAPPLLVAAALHSALDGWSASAADGSGRLGTAFVLAIAVHKIPEGIALGVIVRAAVDSRRAALVWCSAAEAATLAGAALEIVLAPHIGPNVLHLLLALAGGSFLYLGGHAIHGEWRRSGVMPAFVPALAGIASPSVLRLFRILG
jgi:zinc and cadmium transporter